MLQAQAVTPISGGQSGPPPGGASIPLSTLIDFIIQRSYHELTVLADLLPRKSDMERYLKF